MNFTCRKLKCENNKDCVCMLNKINISNTLDCDMLKSSDKDIEDKTAFLFDKVPEFETYKHHNEATITCKADCIFNKEGECMANGIIVNQTEPGTAKCVSYLKK